MTTTAPAIDQLSPSSHACLIYQKPEQQIEVTAQFLKIGLERKERCVFLEMPEKLDQVRRAMQILGVDVADAEARGALVLTAQRGFLNRNRFDRERMHAFLGEAVDVAMKEGYAALRATGDMNWELGAEQDFHQLVDYEAELDQMIKDRKIVGMCQYQRYTVSSLAICNALETHESVVLGTTFCPDNLYYEPPEVKLEKDPERRSQRQGEWKCRQLTRIMTPSPT